MSSGGLQDTYAQDINARAAVHLAFDAFKPGNLAFHRASAPGFAQCRSKRPFFAPHARREVLQFRHCSCTTVLEPSVKVRGLVEAHHALEGLRQLVRFSDHRIGAHVRQHQFVCVIQRFRRVKEQPSQGSWTWEPY